MPPRAQHGITNFVIGALDVELENYLKEIAPGMGIRIAILSLNSGLTTGDYGWNTPSFKRMAKFKFLPVQASPHGLGSSPLVRSLDHSVLWPPLQPRRPDPAPLSVIPHCP